jgi:succinate dehydrogenase / fumarate reductase iron-sulfur subunit/fumarate reductase iron-sulfur subunit
VAIRLTIERSDPGARREFAIDPADVHVVLDLLAQAARDDPSLAYRYSCRSGFCGTCTVVVDGRPGLACQTVVSDDRVHIAPLGGFPVVRDLVVDPTPLASRMAAASGPAVRPTADRDIDAATADLGPDGPPRPIDVGGATLADDSIDCIACGACFAACDMSAADRPFLGPAALTRAMVVIADPATPDRGDRLARVSGTDGIDGCRGIGACSVVCPKGLDPARAIRRLRRWRLVGLP